METNFKTNFGYVIGGIEDSKQLPKIQKIHF